MPPTKGKGRGAGVSGSQSRRGRAPVSRPTPGVTTRSSAAQAEPSPSAQSGERPSKRAKKTNATRQEVADDGSASTVASQADTAAVASPTAAAAQVVSDRASEKEGSAAAPDAAASDSDQVSSPLRRPYLPRSIKSQDANSVIYEPLDSASVCAYLDEKAKYKEKLGMLFDPPFYFFASPSRAIFLISD